MAEIIRSLLHHYPCNEGSSTILYDYGNTKKNGTLVNGATWSAGKIGPYSLSFDGTNDQVTLPASGFGTASLSGLSVVCWIKPLSGIANYGTIYEQYEGVATARISFGVGGPGVGTVNDVLVSVSNGTNINGYTTNALLTASTWKHVAFVFDGTQSTNATKLKVYVNGALQTLTFSAGTIDTSTPANGSVVPYIGRRGQDSNLPFKGSIDDIRFYPRALSIDEIGNLYSLAYGPISNSMDGVADLPFGFITNTLPIKHRKLTGNL